MDLEQKNMLVYSQFDVSELLSCKLTSSGILGNSGHPT